jgi:putative ABC transport system substrate-binding protein
MPATIDRRELMAALGGAAVAWPMTAHAQQRMPVIGMVIVNPKLKNYERERFFTTVREGLAGLGYVEGKDYRFEFRGIINDPPIGPILFGELVDQKFRELVDQKVTLLLVSTTTGLQGAKAATQSIPIVFYIGSDPVENGFVASLNKPGGNMTGVFMLTVTLMGKRVEVLHELVPSATKFAFLTNPAEVLISKLDTEAFQAGAHSLGLNPLIVNARNLGGELDAAFETSVREGAGGMVVGSSTIFYGDFYGDITRIVALTARYNLPTIFVNDQFVRAGGLISYGTDADAGHRLLGNYVGRILKGEKPADIPVQQSTTIKLVINLKTAKALGITVPTLLLGRADEVIE